MQTCSTCKQEKPNSSFYKKRNGQLSDCHECRAARKAESRRKANANRQNRAKVNQVSMTTAPKNKTKSCHMCGRDLPETSEYFFLDNRRNKFYAPCKECKKKNRAKVVAAMQTPLPDDFTGNNWLFEPQTRVLDDHDIDINPDRRRQQIPIGQSTLDNQSSWLPDWMKGDNA